MKYEQLPEVLKKVLEVTAKNAGTSVDAWLVTGDDGVQKLMLHGTGKPVPMADLRESVAVSISTEHVKNPVFCAVGAFAVGALVGARAKALGLLSSDIRALAKCADFTFAACTLQLDRDNIDAVLVDTLEKIKAEAGTEPVTDSSVINVNDVVLSWVLGDSPGPL